MSLAGPMTQRVNQFQYSNWYEKFVLHHLRYICFGLKTILDVLPAKERVYEKCLVFLCGNIQS